MEDPKQKFVTLSEARTPPSPPDPPASGSSEKLPDETRSSEEEAAERAVKTSKFKT